MQRKTKAQSRADPHFLSAQNPLFFSKKKKFHKAIFTTEYTESTEKIISPLGVLGGLLTDLWNNAFH